MNPNNQGGSAGHSFIEGLSQAANRGFQFVNEKAFAPPTNTAKLDGDDLVWFNDLKNQFKVIEPPAAETDPVRIKARDEIQRVTGKNSEDLVGQDLADLETWLIELLPLEDLRQKVNSLREDLQDMAGEDAWKKIQPTLANQVSTATEVQLRPEARRLQQELHWRAAVQPGAQSVRLMLMLKVLIIFLGVMAVAGVMAIAGCVSLETVVFLAGTFGALISCIQRIQSADLTSSRASSLVKNDRLALGVVISPLLGGVFALVMTLILISQTVTSGLIIPDVTAVCATNTAYGTKVTASAAQKGSNSQTNGTSALTVPSSNTMTTSSQPQTALGTNTSPAVAQSPKPLANGGYANAASTVTAGQAAALQFNFFKLLLCFPTGKDLALFVLWAFTAGFFERLVPDLLTRAAKQ
jgi:hypothetical protein